MNDSDATNLMEMLYKIALERELVETERQSIRLNLNKGNTMSALQLVSQLMLSAEFLKRCMEHAIDLHLYFIHQARIKMAMSLIPAAETIVDLGGANGSLYDMGYPYRFNRITVVDLPPEERHEMYRDIELKSRETPNGPIYAVFNNITDLRAFEDGSVDLVWTGQTIEHVTDEEAKRVYQETFRILKPGGHFCLDTPNRILTEIHTKLQGGGWIHPEHKIEYYPTDLKDRLVESGFEIVEEKGICEMNRTVDKGMIDYTDFVVGNTMSDDLERSYIQYYRCRKPS